MHSKFPDASHALHGFRYQFLQSLAAWLNLRPEEELWLEVSEDFSVRSASGDGHDTQVKASRAVAGATKYSLNSKDVKGALRRFWIRAQLNPYSRLTFTANGAAARERDHPFPNSVPGLTYWAAATRGADTTPLRNALGEQFADEPLGAWLATNPNDGELRRRLLSRVTWALNAADTSNLATQLREQVSAIYLDKGLPTIAAKYGWRALTDRVFEVACMSDPDARRLTQVDLHTMIEEATASHNVAKLLGAMAQACPAPFVPVLVSELTDELPSTTLRKQTVTEIAAAVVAEPAIWFHGAHGVGKSTLARLLARELGGRWLSLDLRLAQTDKGGALAAWREITQTIAADGMPDGVIIDDLDSAAIDALSDRMALLAQSIGARGGRIIVTSPKEPSPARTAALGASAAAIVHAPYFTEADVQDLVRNAQPAPDEHIEGWGLVIRVSTAGGHPLLVAAKVASLCARGWPREGLVEDIGQTSEAVRATREDARNVLLQELSDLDGARSLDAGRLLRRLAVIYDRADEGLVRKLSSLSPPIGTAGDALAVLRGSWLEILPGGDLRVSPLLGDIASDVEPDDAKRWQRGAAEYWINGGVLNEQTLPRCFWNAFFGKHDWVLMKLCEVLQQQRNDVLRGAAVFLVPMTSLRTDQSLYPSNEVIAVNIRLLQFQVADAVEADDTGAAIATRLLVELESIKHPELHNLVTVMSASRVLMAQNVRIAPADLVEFALRLRRITPKVQEVGVASFAQSRDGIEAQYGEGVDVAALLFNSNISKLSTSGDFLKTIEALDAIDEADRNSFLHASAAIFDGLSVFTSIGWSGDQLEDRDMTPALAAYEAAAAVAEKWQQPEFMVELACAQSVIRDEGLNDTDGAVAVIDTAIATYGPAPPLVRQKAKVFGHNGRDDEAVDLIISVEDSVGGKSLLDRALALRDAGVSAARVDRFADAARLFSKALDAAIENGGQPALVAGLLVDCAMALWDHGDREGGLRSLAEAFEILEDLDARESRQNERTHMFARGIGGLFFHDIDPFPIGPRPNIAYGSASALSSSSEELANPDLKPLSDNWRILALVEAECSLDIGVSERSLSRLKGAGIASFESMIASARYCTALKGGDIAAAIKAGVAATVAARTCSSAITGSEGLARVDVATLYDTPVATLIAEPLWLNVLHRVPVDVLIYNRLLKTWSPALVIALRDPCAATLGDASIADALLKAGTGRFAVDSDTPFAYLVAAVASRTEEQLATDPGMRFNRDLLFVGHLAQSFARHTLEPLIVPVLANGWAEVLTNNRFRLRAPGRHCSAIEEAVAALPKDGLRAAARLLLAAAPAVGEQLSDNWEHLLRTVAQIFE